MSNLEDRHRALMETQHAENPFAAKTQAALASIEAEKRSKEASGYAWMAAAMSYGDVAEGDGRVGKFTRASKWFVLWFAMLLPSLLIIRVAF